MKIKKRLTKNFFLTNRGLGYRVSTVEKAKLLNILIGSFLIGSILTIIIIGIISGNR